ncbi:MAG: O-antigen ligase family protein, partial [Wujia sp.]
MSNHKSKHNTNLQNKKQSNTQTLQSLKSVDVCAYLYLFLILGIYPLFMDDKYFNITITRHNFFLFATGLYLAIALVAYMLDSVLSKHFGFAGVMDWQREGAWWKHTGFWMMAFFASNLFAWFCAEDPQAAWSGSNGRFMGLCMYLLFAAMFVLLSNRFRPWDALILVFAAASIFAFIVAIFQHMEIDFLHLKDNIAKDQYSKFISTFGNINMFASFLSVAIPVFLAFYVFTEKRLYRIVCAVTLIFAGVTILIANSDSVFLGLAAAFALLFLVTYYKDCMRRFVEGLLCLATGNFILGLINTYANTRYDKKRGGLALTLNRLDVALGMCAVLVVIYIILCILRKKLVGPAKHWNKKKGVAIIVIVGFICCVAGVIVGNKMGISYFVFDEEWGSYRGFIWRKVVSVYGDAPLVNKIFGYGNESMRVILNSVCHDEMIEVTGKVYDNAHNELLQYL